MTSPFTSTPHVVIACGGTGGHLFPGLAVAGQLVKRGCRVTLLISPKEVDQQAVKNAKGLNIVTLPAVALQRGSYLAFFRSSWRSFWAARELFKKEPPQAVLAMGGFTSAPPILAARLFGAHTFLHESNTVPGRANRWLAYLVNQAFIGFPEAAARLAATEIEVTGTPVRPQFQARDAGICRAKLGLDPARPVILVMGGSQGAGGINDLILSALPLLAKRNPNWQWFHLTGPNNVDKVKQTYAKLRLRAAVHPFFAEMELALGAATAAVSRAGASSLAELAAIRLPSVLVPYPTAADNHQFFNARAFTESGAARLLEQKDATPEQVVATLADLVEDVVVRDQMQAALTRWYAPKAAEQIAEIIVKSVTKQVAPVVKNTERSEGAGEINLRAIA